MTGRPSTSTLQTRLNACHQLIAVLSQDPDFGVLTRQALPYAIERQSPPPAYVGYLGVCPDYLNDPQQVQAIRRIIHLRCPWVLERAHYGAGDFLFYCSRHPQPFLMGLETSLKKAGIRDYILASCTRLATPKDDLAELKNLIRFVSGKAE